MEERRGMGVALVGFCLERDFPLVGTEDMHFRNILYKEENELDSERGRSRVFRLSAWL